MAIVHTSTKPTIVAVSFDDRARAIGKGFKQFDNAYEKLTAVVNREFQQFVDAWIVAGNDRGQASCNALGKAIRESQVVIDLDAIGAVAKKTFTEYAQSAMRALHYNVPFSADLKNDADKKLPWSKSATGGKAGPSGKVTSTTRADLDKTLSKALAQARALGLTEFAADVLDLCLDGLDGFKETVLDK